MLPRACSQESSAGMPRFEAFDPLRGMQDSTLQACWASPETTKGENRSRYA